MMKAISPAFQFYPKDWLSDPNVAAMSLEARGIYIHLLAICWMQESLPDDTDQLRAWTGATTEQWERCWNGVRLCFQQTANGDRLVHPRLEKERQIQSEYREKKSRAGRASGRSRKGKEHTANKTERRGNAVGGVLNSPSSSSSTPPTPPGGGGSGSATTEPEPRTGPNPTDLAGQAQAAGCMPQNPNVLTQAIKTFIAAGGTESEFGLLLTEAKAGTKAANGDPTGLLIEWMRDPYHWRGVLDDARQNQSLKRPRTETDTMTETEPKRVDEIDLGGIYE